MTADKYTDYMYNLVARVLNEIGPRESCSESERAAARLLADEWRPLCDRVELEPFTCAPTAFFGFLHILAPAYLLAIVFYWIFPPLAALLSLFNLSLVLFEMIRYREYIDFAYPKREGLNVVGVIRPRGEVKRRVIVSGHIDSAYEFNLWLLFRNAAIPVMIAGIVGVVYAAAACSAKTAAWMSPPAAAALLFNTLGWILMAFYPIAGLFFFFHTYNVVPGAMDDLAGVSVAAGLAKFLNDSKPGDAFFPEHTEVAKPGDAFFPEHTEVVLLGASAEEAGLRGAKRYVRKHLAEMKSIPTFGIFFDGVCDENYLSVVRREIFMGAKHDPKLVKLARDCAAGDGRKILNTVIPFGASDAAAFSRAGVSSVCILAQDTSKLVRNYHTRFDTLENIRPQALTACLQLCLSMLQNIDRS